MASVFSALVPPPSVLAAVRAELDRAGVKRDGGDGLRWSPGERWHITLGHYGDEKDPQGRADWLRARLAGLRSTPLRLEGAGTFPGVLWLGVRGEGLGGLASAAGAERDGRPYRPHLTLARGNREDPRPLREWERRLAGYLGETWIPAEVSLLRSERDDRGTVYRELERYALVS